MSPILQSKLILLLVVVRGNEPVNFAMAIVAHGSEVARLLTPSGRIAKMMNLRRWLTVAERANTAGEADDFEAEIIPPLHLLVGGFESHVSSPLVEAQQLPEIAQ